MGKRSIARNIAKSRMRKMGIVDANKMMSKQGSNGEQLWKSFVKKGTHINEQSSTNK